MKRLFSSWCLFRYSRIAKYKVLPSGHLHASSTNALRLKTAFCRRPQVGLLWRNLEREHMKRLAHEHQTSSARRGAPSQAFTWTLTCGWLWSSRGPVSPVLPHVWDRTPSQSQQLLQLLHLSLELPHVPLRVLVNHGLKQSQITHRSKTFTGTAALSAQWQDGHFSRLADGSIQSDVEIQREDSAAEDRGSVMLYVHVVCIYR